MLNFFCSFYTNIGLLATHELNKVVNFSGVLVNNQQIQERRVRVGLLDNLM